MNLASKEFWKLGLLQVVVLLAFLGWKFYATTSAYLAHPGDGDLYAHSWWFQGIVFCIFGLLPALVGMSLLLGVEWFIVGKIQTWNKRNASLA